MPFFLLIPSIFFLFSIERKKVYWLYRRCNISSMSMLGWQAKTMQLAGSCPEVNLVQQNVEIYWT